ncbi:hypothetical protein SUDANB146_05818 [Streptomyces sp. enrichment culture]
MPGAVAPHHDPASAVDGAVHRTVRDADGLLGSGDAPLMSDCCALREDLVPELTRLAEAGGRRPAVVELRDSLEPHGMAPVIASEGAPLALTGVAAVVGPAPVLPYLSDGDDLAEAGLDALAPTGAPRNAPVRRTPPASPTSTARTPTCCAGSSPTVGRSAAAG